MEIVDDYTADLDIDNLIDLAETESADESYDADGMLADDSVKLYLQRIWTKHPAAHRGGDKARAELATTIRRKKAPERGKHPVV